MIQLRGVCKSYYHKGQPHVVADHIDATFPTNVSVALMGRNGAGKSSLLRMIAGTMNVSSGTIRSNGTVSWPVGFAGSFHGDLTGTQNVKLIARIYRVDTDALIEFVEDFAELGEHFRIPVRTYSAGMRSRLAFGVSMGIKFDTYLVDEVTSVGDAKFREKSEAMFMDRITHSGAIVVSHSVPLLKRICTQGAVLENGKLTWFDTVDAAIEQHERNIQTKMVV